MRIIQNPGKIADGRIFNIGNPENDLSIRELVQTMIGVLSKFPGWSHIPETAEICTQSGTEYYGHAYQDIQHRRPDITLASTLLEWRPTTSIRVGLARTIAFYVQPA